MLIAVIGLILLALVTVGAIVKRYRVAGPNQAFVLTGKNGAKGSPDDQKVILGGGVFVMPVIKQLHVMDLSSRRIPVTVQKAMTKQGIPLNIDAVAMIKVGGTEESVRAAAQRFLSQQSQIDAYAIDTMTGALRSVVGELQVSQITNERMDFSAKVRQVVEETLTGQGLVLDNFEIMDVTDNGGYLADLARPEAAAKRQIAEIAEAEARRAAEQARLATEEQIAAANRDLALKQAEIKAQTDRAQADAKAAGPLAEAARQQEILTQEEQVAVRRAALTERELETTVRKPADAERYRIEQEAEAQRTAQIARAEADKAARIANAEAVAVEGAKTGEAERARRAAIAEAVRAEGESEAAAIAAKGTAEAEALLKRAEAYKQFNEAAVLEMVTEMLPKVAREVAAPMAGIDKLTVISTDGAGALPKTVTSNITQVMQMVSDATGFDVQGLLAGKAAQMAGATTDGGAPAINGTSH
jgi:flotillin